MLCSLNDLFEDASKDVLRVTVKLVQLQRSISHDCILRDPCVPRVLVTIITRVPREETSRYRMMRSTILNMLIVNVNSQANKAMNKTPASDFDLEQVAS